MTTLKITLKKDQLSPLNITLYPVRDYVGDHIMFVRISRGQDVIWWDLLAEIDFFVLSYSLTLG